MVLCVRFPRFELAVATRSLASTQLTVGASAAGTAKAGIEIGLPLALAEHGSRVGEVSGAAEAFGVIAGMTVNEALARCPQLVLVPPDPIGVAEAWEGLVAALEGIGAALEIERPGLAYFDADGLRGIYGGGIEGVLGATRRALDRPARLGAAPTRFCALAASLRARAQKPAVVMGDGALCQARRADATTMARNAAIVRRYLAPSPLSLLSHRASTESLVAPLTRLGLRTLGDLAALPRHAVADRFGEPGLHAWWLTQGQDTPLVPRRREDGLLESLELPEAASGAMLEVALEMLIDRLLARPERRGRTLRAVVLAARLAGGGTWREPVVLREALSDPRRLRLAVSIRLALLPAPAETLMLAVERFGPPSGEQRSLVEEGHEARLRRLREAVRQVRVVAGPYGALRALAVAPDSRVPERRTMLTPFEG